MLSKGFLSAYLWTSHKTVLPYTSKSKDLKLL